MSDLISENLNMIFKTPKGETVHALKDVSFTLKKGELLTVLGPSGCGKTTLLRLISGLERLYQGQIKIYKKTVSSSKVYIPPNKRGLGLVLQEKVLFPHLSILNNVKFGIRGDNDSRKNKALEFLKLFETPFGLRPFRSCLSRFFELFKFAARYQSCQP